MRDFTKPSNLNGYIFESRAIRTLVDELGGEASNFEDIKPRIIDEKNGIDLWREGDIHDYVNGSENEFQGWESSDEPTSA